MQLASRQNLYRRSSLVLMALMALEVTGPIHAQNLSPDAVRRYIDEQVGGIDKLTVPATDADIPVPAHCFPKARLDPLVRSQQSWGTNTPITSPTGLLDRWVLRRGSISQVSKAAVFLRRRLRVNSSRPQAR